jgi:hypothetical protein
VMMILFIQSRSRQNEAVRRCKTKELIAENEIYK